MFVKSDRNVHFEGRTEFYTQGGVYSDTKVLKFPEHFVAQAFDRVDDEVAAEVDKLLGA